MADWYYIGHYGQLGPLTLEQMEELIQGGVIARDTYVWRTGMNEWVVAGQRAEFQASFALADPYVSPPPPPVAGPPSVATTAGYATPQAPPVTALQAQYSGNPYLPYAAVKSDRSRVIGGVLQIIIPGAGRMYLGYMAYGVLQLFLTVCTFGVGWLWGLIDGILILTGGIKLDGYGRVLSD